MTVRIAHSLDDLAPWKDQWDALAAAQRLPMLHYAWFQAAERCLAAADSVRVVYVLDPADSLIAACALERRCDSVGRISYQILGMSRLYEPSALLHRDPPARAALIAALGGLEFPVILARLWPDTHAPDSIAHGWRPARRALHLGKPIVPSQYLQLTGDYVQYAESLPSQRRYDLRRAYRRAETAGQLQCDIVTPAPADLHAPLTMAFEVESRSWKARSGSAVLTTPGLREFFFTILQTFAAERRVLIALLYSDGTPIAAQVCLSSYQRLWLLKIGYDEAFAKLSPGLILMNEVIKHSYQQGMDGLEFLGSAEDWVEAWRPQLRPYQLLVLYPYTPRCLARLARDISGALLRKLRRAVPE